MYTVYSMDQNICRTTGRTCSSTLHLRDYSDPAAASAPDPGKVSSAMNRIFLFDRTQPYPPYPAVPAAVRRVVSGHFVTWNK